MTDANRSHQTDSLSEAIVRVEAGSGALSDLLLRHPDFDDETTRTTEAVVRILDAALMWLCAAGSTRSMTTRP
jgi:hypothetical protein